MVYVDILDGKPSNLEPSFRKNNDGSGQLEVCLDSFSERKLEHLGRLRVSNLQNGTFPQQTVKFGYYPNWSPFLMVNHGKSHFSCLITPSHYSPHL